ncbi:MAG: AmmeMemoRadiSam system protein B [Phycisphaerae bacterium]|nr:AmmeMemoRadiSam system protein B [Phycisphaerae bacterium]
MLVREPVQAGRFYPAQQAQCRREVEAHIAQGAHPIEGAVWGGIVPHAGWAYSGKVAGEVFATLSAKSQPTTVVLFGAVHRHGGCRAALFPSGSWETPLGPVEVDGRLAERVLGHTNLIVEDACAHEQEHSIEVQLPFIHHLFPEAKILPIMVPPTAEAVAVGESVAHTVEAYQTRVLLIGSTDLTHYGPSYGFVPEGAGSGGLIWAKEVNDRRMIDLICGLQAEAVVPESQLNHNACGAGAIAATISGTCHLGADRAVLLRHTTSHEVLSGLGGADAVGYAGIVFASSQAQA